MVVEVTEALPEIAMAQAYITVHVSASLNVTRVAARRKVNVFLLNDVGTGLGGDTPALVVHDNRLCWRVPMILALPPCGRLGSVGQIDVDAQTGEILAGAQSIREISDNAERLVADFAL